MKRMNNLQVPVIATLPFMEIECGFMRDNRGNIIFLTTHGRETVPFPVLEDGSISKHGDVDALTPYRRVSLVDPKDIGIDINRLLWTNQTPSL